MIKNRVEVTTVDANNEQIKLYVTRPNHRDLSAAQLIASAVINEGLQKKAVFRDKLVQTLIEQGLWTQEKEEQLQELDKSLFEDLVKLKKGGMKLSEARELALLIRGKRALKVILDAERRKLDAFTVEALAENAKFDYLVSVCVKDEEGNLFYKNLDDYKDRASEKYSIDVATKLAELIHDFDSDWEKKLPENQFLLKHKFMDDNLRLINKDGKYVTIDNKLIDKDYNYIDEESHKTNSEGVLIDEVDGLPVVEKLPFLDDEGNPI